MRGNIKSHYNSIPFKQLPKAIRDVMLATRELGFTHFYIDTLCLIQDCKKDKEEEIPRIGDNYRESILKIYAWAAEDDEQSLASTRDFQLSKPCTL